MVIARAPLALAVLAACGGKTDTHASQSRPASSSEGAAAKAPAAPSSEGAAAGSAPASTPGRDVTRAFVADGSGLVEVSIPGGAQVVAPTTASWCSVDARANVVWFTAVGGLHVYDLDDRRTRTIIKGGLEDIIAIIVWGPKQRLGGENPGAFEVGAVLRLADKPKLDVETGCDGTAMYTCFENGDPRRPQGDVADRMRRVRRLSLEDPAYVASLAARGKDRSLWLPPPMPPAPPKQKPTVDRKQCHGASICGELVAIPASPWWLVKTALNSGGYYSETRDLWDPATGEYLRRDGAKLVRSKAVPPSTDDDGHTDYAGLRVSPTGLLAFGGAVFDTAKVHYAPRPHADFDVTPVSCGFLGGDWRVPGPSD